MVFVGSIVMVCVSISTGRIPEGWVINSDTLYLPALFQDFFINHNDISGWRLATNPYFIPDMVIYFTINTLSDNIRLNFLAYGVIQSLLFMVSLLVLSNQLFGIKKIIHILFLLVGIIFFFLVSLNDYYVYSFPLITVTHFGILLIIPVALTLVLQIMKNQINIGINIIILVLLSILTTVSDLFYTVQFLIPAVFSVLYVFLLSAITPRKTILLNFSLIGSLLTGIILHKAIDKYNNVSLYTQVEPKRIIESSSFFLICLKEFLSSYPFFSLLWISFVLVIILLLISSFKSFYIQKQRGSVDFLFIQTFIFFAILINIVIVVLSGNFVDIGSIRYFIPVLIIPTFFGWPFLLAGAKTSLTILMNRYSMIVLNSTLGVLLFFIFTTQNMPAISKWVNDTPDLVQCLDEKTHQMGIKNGVTHYWQARYVSLLSENNLHLVPVNQALIPYHWVNNLNEYNTDFEFVLIDKTARPEYLIDESTIINRFGQPASLFNCGNTTAFVYNRSEDIQFQKQFKGSPYLAEFDNLNNEFEFYGSNLPSSTGKTVGLSREANEEWGSEAGFLTYGPYVGLPAGDYEFEIHYYNEGENVGKWDVISSSDVVVIKEGDIVGQKQGKNIISETFTLRTG